MTCGVTHRHPNGSLHTFMEHFNSTVERIHKEHTFCVMMEVTGTELKGALEAAIDESL